MQLEMLEINLVLGENRMTLSDKIYEVEQEASGYTPEIVISKDDVKEFIQNVRESNCVCMEGQTPCYFCKDLNKLSGDALCVEAVE